MRSRRRRLPEEPLDSPAMAAEIERVNEKTRHLNALIELEAEERREKSSPSRFSR